MSVVIIPAYKPDETLVTITDQLWGYGCRIVVVDDGSGEKYQPIFEKISDISIILRHSENRGKGAAIKTALTYVKEEFWDGNVIGVMDCDGQHLPEDMMKLFTFAATHRKTMVLGVREVGKDMPLKSRLGNQITRTVFRLLSGVKVTDTQTGLRAFSSELLDQLISVEGERYEYEMNVLMVLAKAGIPIEEVPIHTIYRDKNNSGSHFRAVQDSIRIYKDIFKFMLSSFSSFILDYVLFSLFMIFLPHTAALVLVANIAARMKSVLAVNGDSYSNNRHEDNGTIIRNGVIYRNKQTTEETCVLNWDGTMDIYQLGQVDLQQLVDRGAYQSWIFGPSLLDESGKAKSTFLTWDYIRESHPRTAIGYYEPGHYCLLLVDGRQDSSRGMFLDEMAKVFEDLGCKAAYNLDGGHCSFMTMKNQVANHPYKPEHEVEDGIFITEGL